jgi:hypothetical protein
MALAGCRRELITSEEQKESGTLEDEVSGTCSWGFESDKRGAWQGMEARVLTWERLRVEAKADLGYQKMVEALPYDPRSWPKGLEGMARYRDSLSSVDRVLMFGDRVVVPKSLRREVLGTLHAEHQGVTCMLPGGQQLSGGLR